MKGALREVSVDTAGDALAEAVGALTLDAAAAVACSDPSLGFDPLSHDASTIAAMSEAAMGRCFIGRRDTLGRGDEHVYLENRLVTP